MPYQFGVDTSTILLKHEGHKLHQAFTVEDNTAFIIADADLVTLNVINGTVNGVAISQVTFSGTHATTMGLLATELASLASVASATVIGTHRIKIVAALNSAPITEVTLTVTLGATQAVITPSYDQNQLVMGRPVVLNEDGTVAPAQVESATQDIIGFAINAAIEAEDVTVDMRAYVILFCEWKSASSVAGPIIYETFNALTGLNEVDDTAPTTLNMWGWALDPGDDGEITRVALL